MRKCTSTKKAHVHSLFITFDVLWMYVVTKKVGFYEQYFVFWFIQILTFCKSLSYRHFCEKLGWQMWLNFHRLTKSFAESFLRDFLWFQRAFLSGNISINTLVFLFSFFIFNLCANKIYISNWFIVILHMPLYYHIAIFLLKYF